MSRLLALVVGAGIMLALAACEDNAYNFEPVEGKRTIFVTMYADTGALKQAFEDTRGKKQIAHKQVRAFAEFNDKLTFCHVYIVAPTSFTDWQWAKDFFHEWRHCQEGRWHDAAGKEYPKEG